MEYTLMDEFIDQSFSLFTTLAGFEVMAEVIFAHFRKVTDVKCETCRGAGKVICKKCDGLDFTTKRGHRRFRKLNPQRWQDRQLMKDHNMTYLQEIGKIPSPEHAYYRDRLDTDRFRLKKEDDGLIRERDRLEKLFHKNWKDFNGDLEFMEPGSGFTHGKSMFRGDSIQDHPMPRSQNASVLARMVREEDLADTLSKLQKEVLDRHPAPPVDDMRKRHPINTQMELEKDAKLGFVDEVEKFDLKRYRKPREIPKGEAWMRSDDNDFKWSDAGLIDDQEEIELFDEEDMRLHRTPLRHNRIDREILFEALMRGVKNEKNEFRKEKLRFIANLALNPREVDGLSPLLARMHMKSFWSKPGEENSDERESPPSDLEKAVVMRAMDPTQSSQELYDTHLGERTVPEWKLVWPPQQVGLRVDENSGEVKVDAVDKLRFLNEFGKLVEPVTSEEQRDGAMRQASASPNVDYIDATGTPSVFGFKITQDPLRPVDPRTVFSRMEFPCVELTSIVKCPCSTIAGNSDYIRKPTHGTRKGKSRDVFESTQYFKFSENSREAQEAKDKRDRTEAAGTFRRLRSNSKLGITDRVTNELRKVEKTDLADIEEEKDMREGRKFKVSIGGRGHQRKFDKLWHERDYRASWIMNQEGVREYVSRSIRGTQAGNFELLPCRWPPLRGTVVCPTCHGNPFYTLLGFNLKNFWYRPVSLLGRFEWAEERRLDAQRYEALARRKNPFKAEEGEQIVDPQIMPDAFSTVRQPIDVELLRDISKYELKKPPSSRIENPDAVDRREALPTIRTDDMNSQKRWHNAKYREWLSQQRNVPVRFRDEFDRDEYYNSIVRPYGENWVDANLDRVGRMSDDPSRADLGEPDETPGSRILNNWSHLTNYRARDADDVQLESLTPEEKELSDLFFPPRNKITSKKQRFNWLKHYIQEFDTDLDRRDFMMNTMRAVNMRQSRVMRRKWIGKKNKVNDRRFKKTAASRIRDSIEKPNVAVNERIRSAFYGDSTGGQSSDHDDNSSDEEYIDADADADAMAEELAVGDGNDEEE